MADLSPRIWKTARIVEIRPESSRVKTFRLKFGEAYNFVAGQHCSLQIITPAGQTIARDYSFSSAPSSGGVELTVAKMPQGELSSWLVDAAVVGDKVKVSPAVGGNFTWTDLQTTPLLLVGGGIGIAPLMSIWREHMALSPKTPLQLIYSCRGYEDICFKNELLNDKNSLITLTNLDLLPPTWTGQQGRLNADQLRAYLLPEQVVYISGSNAFVHDISAALATLDLPPGNLRKELFG